MNDSHIISNQNLIENENQNEYFTDRNQNESINDEKGNKFDSDLFLIHNSKIIIKCQRIIHQTSSTINYF